MDNNIYNKLVKMREAVSKTPYRNFDELLEVINKKAKYHKVLPLYCFYDKVATLTILDLECITTCVKFQIPVELVGMENVKQYLYQMAFDLNGVDNYITYQQISLLHIRMKEVDVKPEKILERYNIKSIMEMTPDIYRRCMEALDKTEKENEENGRSKTDNQN